MATYKTGGTVGCEHNIDRYIIYPDTDNMMSGDLVVFRCDMGCPDLTVELSGQRKEPMDELPI